MNRAVRHAPEAGERPGAQPGRGARRRGRAADAARAAPAGGRHRGAAHARGDGSLSPTLRRTPTVGPGRRAELHAPARCFAERIEDPRAYATEHPVDWAVGAIWLVRPGVLRRARRVRRVVLPLLRGDGLRAARPGPRLALGVRAGRRRHARGRRLGHEPRDAHHADAEPGAPDPAAERHRGGLDVLRDDPARGAAAGPAGSPRVVAHAAGAGPPALRPAALGASDAVLPR